MHVVYERSGGFVGMMQSLRIEDGALKARDRGRLLNSRDLTDEEAEQLGGLLDRMGSAEAPIDNPGAGRASDSYSVVLNVGNEPEPRVSISTLTLPVMGAGEYWDELLGYLDRLLTTAIQEFKDSGQALPPKEAPGSR